LRFVPPEYHPTHNGFPFCSASGLAVITVPSESEILSPHISRDGFFGYQKTGGVSTNASLDEPDANENPIALHSGL
jgi:hypothetical protein